MTTRTFFSILFFLTLNTAINAQYQQDWIAIFEADSLTDDASSDEVHDMIMDNSGNMYLTGKISETTSGSSGSDMITLKYDNNGNLEWYRIYERANMDIPDDDEPYDQGKSIDMDSEGNVYVVGFSSGNVVAEYDIIVVKYSPDGTLLWEKDFDLSDERGLEHKDRDEANVVKVNSNDEIFVAGYGNNQDDTTVFYSDDFVLLKYQADSTLQWYETYDFSGDDDRISDITFDEDGNVYTIGMSEYSSDQELTVRRYASDGSPGWYDRLGDLGNGELFIRTDHNNDVILAYTTYGDTTRDDLAVVKYSSSGTPQWSDYYDNVGKDDKVRDVVIDDQNNIIVAGSSEQDNSGGYEII